MSKIHIIQHGVDGMGHQLHAIFSCLALHNISKYYFDGQVFINKPFTFDHINGEEANAVKNYFIEIVKKFIENNNQIQKRYRNIIHSHEVYEIPENYDENTIYSLDNSYYFDRIPINESEFKKYLVNIKNYKYYFINDKLPSNRLSENNVVIHLRQGDAMTTGRGNVINKHNKQLIKVMPLLTREYQDYVFYIHTDGDATFLTNILSEKNIKFILFKKSENILNVLSDFIYSKIFISGHSGLSTVCTFLGNHKMIIIPDDIKHSVPENAIRISKYEDTIQ